MRGDTEMGETKTWVIWTQGSVADQRSWTQEAEEMSVEGGALVFRVDGEVKVAVGLGHWATVELDD